MYQEMSPSNNQNSAICLEVEERITNLQREIICLEVEERITYLQREIAFCEVEGPKLSNPMMRRECRRLMRKNLTALRLCTLKLSRCERQ